jgi:hypothetical protein
MQITCGCGVSSRGYKGLIINWVCLPLLPPPYIQFLYIGRARVMEKFPPLIVSRTETSYAP